MVRRSRAPERPKYDPTLDVEFPPPGPGRSVHVVGTVVNVHPDETPHPKVRRGEMGKVLFDYGRNTISADPIARTNSQPLPRPRQRLHRRAAPWARGQDQSRQDAGRRSEADVAHIKNVGHYFGADIVGIGRAHPALLYAGGTLRDTGFIVDAGEAAQRRARTSCAVSTRT